MDFEFIIRFLHSFFEKIDKNFLSIKNIKFPLAFRSVNMIYFLSVDRSGVAQR